jgi:hypothetical protein
LAATLENGRENNPAFAVEQEPVFGAGIFCCVCGARPYPIAGEREDFDLVKLKDTGVPACEGQGHWYCSSHFARVERPQPGEPLYRIITETELPLHGGRAP